MTNMNHLPAMDIPTLCLIIPYLELELKKFHASESINNSSGNDVSSDLLVRQQVLQGQLEAVYQRLAELVELQGVEDMVKRAKNVVGVHALVATTNVGAPCAVCHQAVPNTLVATACKKKGQLYHRLWCCGAICCTPCLKQRHQRVIEARDARDAANTATALVAATEEYQAARRVALHCPSCYATNQGIDHMISLLRRQAQAAAAPAWAVYDYGNILMNCFPGGSAVLKANEPARWKAAQFLQTSAERDGNVDAMLLMGMAWMVGFPEQGLAPNQKEQDKYIATAAFKGHSRAQVIVGSMTDGNEARMWYSLAARQGCERGQYKLGEWHYRNKQRSGSSLLALFQSLYWLKKAALQGEGDAQFLLSLVMLEVKAAVFGKVDLVGNSAIPEALYWFDVPKFTVNDMVGTERPPSLRLARLCGCCGRRDNSRRIVPLRRCAQCKSIHYCSKECQTAHWKMGHKLDCRAMVACQMALTVPSDVGYAYPVHQSGAGP